MRQNSTKLNQNTFRQATRFRSEKILETLSQRLKQFPKLECFALTNLFSHTYKTHQLFQTDAGDDSKESPRSKRSKFREYVFAVLKGLQNGNASAKPKCQNDVNDVENDANEADDVDGKADDAADDKTVVQKVDTESRLDPDVASTPTLPKQVFYGIRCRLWETLRTLVYKVRG